MGTTSFEPPHNFLTGVNQCSSTFSECLEQAEANWSRGKVREEVSETREDSRESGEGLRGEEMMGSQVRRRMNE